MLVSRSERRFPVLYKSVSSGVSPQRRFGLPHVVYTGRGRGTVHSTLPIDYQRFKDRFGLLVITNWKLRLFNVDEVNASPVLYGRGTVHNLRFFLIKVNGCI